MVSNGRGSIDRRRTWSVSLDAFYDFPGAWGAISPYLGAGAGQAFVEMAGVRFATDHRNVSTAAEFHDPPLSFYNSVQDTDLNDTAWVLRVHIGADYALSARASLGLRLTWSATGEHEDASGYVTHPMHGIDPGFKNVNAFGGALQWTLTLAYRRGVGE